MTRINVNVNQVTRVEGHGNIVLNVSDGKIDDLRWEVTESPRLFEVMLRGREYEDVPHIASRICGICSISHTTASIQAVEAAFGFNPSEQTKLLRKFRDRILNTTVGGQALTSLYYEWSPAIGYLMKKDENVKVWIRELVEESLPLVNAVLQ